MALVPPRTPPSLACREAPGEGHPETGPPMTSQKRRPDLLAQLEEGILRLTSSDAWQDYLVFQSRFHRYSYGNVLLIAAQNQQATCVAGFRAWARHDRFVRKGEKAIWILAPMVGKTTDPTKDDERVVRGFKYVPVF